MKMNFRERLYRFMYGRYGADELYKFLTVVFYVVFFANLFIKSAVLSIITLLILFWSTYRVMSRSIYKRRLENEKYLSVKKKVSGFFTLQKNRIKDRKTHVYKKCPKCGAVLRLPREKGEHSVRCPKCSERFEVKI